MSRSIPAAIMVALLVACRESPLEPLAQFPFTYATNSCGPTDAPIVAVYLASQSFELPQPSAPYIQVHLPTSFEELNGGDVFQIRQLFTEANAWFYASGVDARIARRGEVGITDLGDSVLEGYIDIEFTDGPKFRGSFAAVWQRRQLLCG